MSLVVHFKFFIIQFSRNIFTSKSFFTPHFRPVPGYLKQSPHTFLKKPKFSQAQILNLTSIKLEPEVQHPKHKPLILFFKSKSLNTPHKYIPRVPSISLRKTISKPNHREPKPPNYKSSPAISSPKTLQGFDQLTVTVQ